MEFVAFFIGFLSMEGGLRLWERAGRQYNLYIALCRLVNCCDSLQNNMHFILSRSLRSQCSQFDVFLLVVFPKAYTILTRPPDQLLFFSQSGKDTVHFLFFLKNHVSKSFFIVLNDALPKISSRLILKILLKIVLSTYKYLKYILNF